MLGNNSRLLCIIDKCQKLAVPFGEKLIESNLTPKEHNDLIDYEDGKWRAGLKLELIQGDLWVIDSCSPPHELLKEAYNFAVNCALIMAYRNIHQYLAPAGNMSITFGNTTRMPDACLAFALPELPLALVIELECLREKRTS